MTESLIAEALIAAQTGVHPGPFACALAAIDDLRVAGLDDDELVSTVLEAERFGRAIDALRVRLAGEVSARSDSGRGDARLTLRHGAATASTLLASLTGVSGRTARERMRLADAIRSTMSAVGLPNESRFPEVQRALHEGRLGQDAAQSIVGQLTRAAERCGFGADLHDAEQFLVTGADRGCGVTSSTTDGRANAGALAWSADEVARLAVRLREHLDPDGAEPRDRELVGKRCLTIVALTNGMTRFTALLPPEQAAVWLALAETMRSPRTGPTFPLDVPPVPCTGSPASPDDQTAASGGAGDDSHTEQASAGPASAEPASTDPATADPASADPASADPAFANPMFADPVFADPVCADPVFAETRSPGQLLADGFTSLLSAAAGLEHLPRLNGARPTVNVHATLDDIVSGVGVGWVDGLDEPLPASAVAQLLCHADRITTLLGDGGRILQHGKTKRLFTAAQNRALAVRDGGCVWPGCDRPPSWCETHHVEPWLHDEHPPGRTDVDNGVLLCHFHHSNVHRSDWKLTMRQGVPHIVPPGSVDWRQVPRALGRQQNTLLRR